MNLKPGDTLVVGFNTQVFATGVATNADSLPTAIVRVNGAADDWSESVANVSAGDYEVSATVPGDLSDGDTWRIVVSATVSTVAGKETIANGMIVTKRNSDLQDLTAAAVNAECDSALSDAGIVSSLTTIAGYLTHVTYGLSAILTQGNAAWITAAGFSTHNAAAVVSALSPPTNWSNMVISVGGIVSATEADEGGGQHGRHSGN